MVNEIETRTTENTPVSTVEENVRDVEDYIVKIVLPEPYKQSYDYDDIVIVPPTIGTTITVTERLLPALLKSKGCNEDLMTILHHLRCTIEDGPPRDEGNNTHDKIPNSRINIYYTKGWHPYMRLPLNVVWFRCISKQDGIDKLRDHVNTFLSIKNRLRVDSIDIKYFGIKPIDIDDGEIIL